MEILFESPEIVVVENNGRIRIAAESRLVEEVIYLEPARLYGQDLPLLRKLERAQQLGLEFKNGKTAREQIALHIPNLTDKEFESLKTAAAASAKWELETCEFPTGECEPTRDGGGAFVPDGGMETRTQLVRTIEIQALPGYVPQKVKGEFIFTARGKTWAVKEREDLHGCGGFVSDVPGLPPQLLKRALAEEEVYRKERAEIYRQHVAACVAAQEAEIAKLKEELSEYLL